MRKVKTKTGKSVCLLNPNEKKKKFQREIKNGIARTNEGGYKLDKNKKGIRLTEKQKNWRAGFISGVIESQKAYHGNKAKRRGK